MQKIFNQRTFLNSIIFICAISFGQKTPIDYNNFDTQTASTMLFEKLNDFRDTITVTGYGKPLTESWPILKNNRGVNQWISNSFLDGMDSLNAVFGGVGRA